MTKAERDWNDGQPGDALLDEGGSLDRAAPADPPVEGVHEDPLVERVHEEPAVEHVHEEPLVEPVREDDPLVQAVHEGDPLVEEVHHGDPLPEPVPVAADSADGAASARPEPGAPLDGTAEHERFVARWQEIQAGFVDEPRRAVQDADALVVDMMDRLARMLAAERDQIESRGSTGGDPSTEDLRQGLRRYRALFERLLAV